MYYIINHNGHVIAASSNLLEKLEVNNIDALYKQMALDAIEFSAEEDGVTLKTPLNETHYHIEKETLSSILGDMTLIHLNTKGSVAKEESIIPMETENKISPSTDTEDDISLLDHLDLDDEVLFTLQTEGETPTEDETEKAEEPILLSETEEEPDKEVEFSLLDELDEEELFGIKEESTETEESSITPETAEESSVTEEEDLFDLILPNNAEETIGKIEEEKSTSNTPIYIDVEQISQSIGITSEDYNTFLTEYIDTALTLEDDLKSNDQTKRTAAIHTLFHLSNVLRLPVITEIIEQLKYTEDEDIENSIQSFYHTLSRLTTSQPEVIEIEENELSIENPEEALNTTEEVKGFGTIDLSDVKPIHFDFRVEEAADELSLPAELIEEFIHDFIKQAHEETDKMLQAYEKGDLDTIQKIGHLLKGTASNLRINPLSDTLYEIQFCDDPSKLDTLIKEYWAHFIAFETQFNLTSQH